MFLDNDEYLQALGAKVYVMNPKQIANFKKSYSDMDKTDEIDAFVIADYLRFGRMPMTVVKEEQVRCTSTVDTGKILIGAPNHARKTTLPSIFKQIGRAHV